MVTFDHEGAHLAVCHVSQSYSANGRPDALLFKSSTPVTQELMKSLESVYEKCLTYELQDRGFYVETQVPVPLTYRGIALGEGFKADMIINRKVIVELKSLEIVKAVHKKQLLTYLKLADKRVGLLLNFGDVLLKGGIHRVVNNYIDDF